MRRWDKKSHKEKIDHRARLGVGINRMEQLIPYEAISEQKKVKPTKLLPLSSLFKKPIKSRRDDDTPRLRAVS